MPGRLAALVFYEHAITFQRELTLIWRRKFSIPSLLFICIRYVLLCNAIVSLAIDLSWEISVRVLPLSYGRDVVTDPFLFRLQRYALCFGLLVGLVIKFLASCAVLQRINEVSIVLTYLTSAGRWLSIQFTINTHP